MPTLTDGLGAVIDCADGSKGRVMQASKCYRRRRMANGLITASTLAMAMAIAISAASAGSAAPVEDHQGQLDIDPVWSAPEPTPDPPSSQARPGPMRGPFQSLRDGRGLLETTVELRIRRLPDGPDSHPITHEVTNFDKWVALCESREHEKACFAATYTADADKNVLRVKIGPGEASTPDPDATPLSDKKVGPGQKALPAAARRGPRRYVLSLEGPPGLDVDTGFDIIATRAAGFLSIDRTCDQIACHATAEIADDIAPLLAPGAPDGEEGFAVVASYKAKPMIWRFSTAGLRKAFDRVKAESEEPKRDTQKPEVVANKEEPKAPTGKPLEIGIPDSKPIPVMAKPVALTLHTLRAAKPTQRWRRADRLHAHDRLHAQSRRSKETRVGRFTPRTE